MHYVIEKLVNRSSACYINAPASKLSRVDTLVSFDINDVHWTEVNSTERYGAFLPPLLSLRCTQWPAGQCFLWTELTALHYHLVPAMPLSCRPRDEFAVAEKKGRKCAASYFCPSPLWSTRCLFKLVVSWEETLKRGKHFMRSAWHTFTCASTFFFSHEMMISRSYRSPSTI